MSLGDIISDTMKFAFLFFEFFIPYTVAFWILFGENRTGDEVEKAHPDWVQFNDLVYSIWTVSNTLLISMEKSDRSKAHTNFW